MRRIAESNIRNVYHRFNTLEWHLMREYCSPKVATISRTNPRVQFVLLCDDDKFYPVRAGEKLPPHVRWHAGIYAQADGFDTLEQATLWWDTCSQ